VQNLETEILRYKEELEAKDKKIISITELLEVRKTQNNKL
jgi:hypothetical protein